MCRALSPDHSPALRKTFSIFGPQKQTSTGAPPIDYTEATEVARAYGAALSKAFGHRLSPQTVEPIGDADESYWRLSLPVPQTLAKNVSKLFELEKKAYEHLEQSHPGYVGFFAVRYLPRG